MKTNSFLKLLLLVGVLLLIPLIGMQVSDEVNWSEFNFLVAAVLLLVFGSVVLLVVNKIKTKKTRTLFVVGILFLLFLIWAELAVGVFGTPFAGS
ncbi:hypothetical protein [Psychroflexus planctonicus]|uniref:Uncharacterized protein n=1 Tax=Psychroflexus planctonicus TaxID=1526575 RepID=A0ABQ1SFK4_9FLAO|nr:hypothetical protein [Psychroflexus planctonicus]GGE25607.1 hypothetical protein GCM10010832_02950 [Psychroflexus planctonicus]